MGVLKFNSSAHYPELIQIPQVKGHSPQRGCSYYRYELQVQRGPQATGTSDWVQMWGIP